MKRYLYILILFCLPWVSNAQQSLQDKIASARVAFLSDKLELTPDQARVFWPLYNEYSDKKQELKKQIKSLKVESNTLNSTDDQIKTDILRFFELRKQEVALDNEYYNKFLKVISVRQVAELIKAEKQFTLMLLKKLEEGK